MGAFLPSRINGKWARQQDTDPTDGLICLIADIFNILTPCYTFTNKVGKPALPWPLQEKLNEIGLQSVDLWLENQQWIRGKKLN